MFVVGKYISIFTVLLLFLQVNFISSGFGFVARSFTDNEIVPDVLQIPPNLLLRVTYANGIEVNLGNELTPTNVRNIPNVQWNADPNAFYTLAMIDPDAPSRTNITMREFQHWLVGNIPGNNVANGFILTEYVGSAPPENTGLHRYVFLVYRQPSNLDFTEDYISDDATNILERISFSISNFAQKYGMGNPIFGNFFQAQYED